MSAPRWRAVVAEDERAARAALCGLVEGVPDFELVAACADGRSALDVIRRVQPHVVFLDVHMPGLDGLRVLDALAPEERPLVVFTTAFGQHAVRAFEFDAADYLLKPFSDARFHEAVARVRARLETRPRSAPAASPYAQQLVIPRTGAVDVVEVAELLWIEASNQYATLHCESGDHLMRTSLSELEQQLDPARFLRVHRSAIIALRRALRLETGTGRTGRVQLQNGDWVPVSRTHLPTLRRSLGR